MSRDRDYEAELAQAFPLLGWQVVSRKEWAGQPLTVVREYMPKPVNKDGVTKRWLLDFSHPPSLVYLEIDGFGGSPRSGHRNWTGFHRDREKDRLLTFGGWRHLRYGPGDLSQWCDTLQAAQDMIDLIKLIEERKL